ncbi:hypothetical protein Lfu02_43840 [Longispora fulva]|uniref:Outer membrane protein assembly factor BamB n=1 Tax=Longispora fulva TaxID=619741 RepID=A0A8J7KPY8_9ACTN|nr:PQQ-binding-like beta-propeller repeat protein [Longispora fulva]MBG6136842.1 hypothetical protein [Longispora fulva]GIG60012.1 hypothetical protein Lfu02_43840 [Longispora fulva]
MSDDLKALFGALRADADELRLPAPSAARRIGTRRRRVRLGAGLATVILLVAGVTVGASWWGRTPADPVGFARLRPVGVPVAESGVGAGGAVKARTVDGRTMFVWPDKSGELRLTVVDLATGTAARPTSSLGRYSFVSGMWTVAGVLVLTVRGGSDARSSEMLVVDPATGTTLWHRAIQPTAERSEFFLAGLVVNSVATQRTELLDWRTGATRWSVPTTGLQNVLSVRSVAGLGVSTDHRLLLVGQDHVLRVYDVRDGSLLLTGPTVDGSVQAYDGKAYVLGLGPDGVSGRLSVFDLDDPGRGLRLLYTARTEVTSVANCAPGLVCALEQAVVEPSGAAVDSAVVAVDLNGGGERWRYRLTIPFGVLGMAGDRVLAPGVVLDPGGRKLVGPPAEHLSLTGPTVDGGLLAYSVPASGPATRSVDLDVYGVLLADGKVTTLGTVTVLPNSCSADQRFLACATDRGFEVWQYRT